MDAKSGSETSSNAEPEESKDANATTHEKVYEYLLCKEVTATMS